MATFSDYFLKVGNTELNDPSPRKFEVSKYELDVDSDRNASGNLIRNVVNTKYKLSVEFPPMFGAKLKTLLSAIDHSSLSIQFWDQESETYITKTFYHNDLTTSPLLKRVDSSILYDAFSVNFIEY